MIFTCLYFEAATLEENEIITKKAFLMKTKRLLLDRGIAPIIHTQLNDANIKYDDVTIKKGTLKSLLKNGDYSGLIVRSKTSITPDILKAAGKNLQVVGVVGDTLENININYASRQGILVKAAQYVNAYEVANLSLRLIAMLMSASFRDRIDQQACIVKDNQNCNFESLSGFELAGTTVGLIGCGKVAQSLAHQIKPYCKRIIGYDNHFKSVYENFHKRNLLDVPVIEYASLSEVLAYSNVISIHTAGSEKVFKGKELYYAKQKPFIVNTSRSGLVNEESLLAALREKRVSGAAMTLEPKKIKSILSEKHLSELFQMKNVLIAPADGRPSSEKKKKSIRKLVRAVVDFLDTKDLSLAVNPMEVFPGSRKVKYPLSRQQSRSARPLISFSKK
ncbi:MAG: hypothetical protein HKP55_12135 [Gammaproteobacteria bacterium]|nr:hypothetical protein [Gammaproteobacteria bacterium]